MVTAAYFGYKWSLLVLQDEVAPNPDLSPTGPLQTQSRLLSSSLAGMSVGAVVPSVPSPLSLRLGFGLGGLFLGLMLEALQLSMPSLRGFDLEWLSPILSMNAEDVTASVWEGNTQQEEV